MSKTDPASENKVLTCTLVGFSNTATFTITAQNPLPAHVSISLNGAQNDGDECASEIPTFYNLKFSDDRRQVQFSISLENSNHRSTYFKNDSYPESDLATLELFSRNECKDTPVKFSQLDNVKIVWEAFEGNGPGCGFNYNGQAQAQIQ